MATHARRKAAGYLRRLAERLSPTVRMRDIPYPDPSASRQAKALEELVKEQRQANKIARRDSMRDEMERDRVVLSMDLAQTGVPMQEGVKVRIDSNGTGKGTRIMAGDEPITNAVRATWTVDADGIARALIECDAVTANIEGETRV